MVRRTLLIFARAPRLGRGKRRLAADIGDVPALRFHRLTTDATIRSLAGDPRWHTMLAVTGEGFRWPRHIRKVRQTGRGLGERMANAIRATPQGATVLVGTDIPDIAPHHIARAFRALASHDVAFGPATDGGYWLVGLRDRALLRGLFRNVRWSTVHALADTMANLPRGRRHALVDVLEDVDDAPALRRRQIRP